MKNNEDEMARAVSDLVEEIVGGFGDEVKGQLDEIIAKRGGVSNLHLHVLLSVKAYLYTRLRDKFEEEQDLVGAHEGLDKALESSIEDMGIGLGG